MRKRQLQDDLICIGVQRNKKLIKQSQKETNLTHDENNWEMSKLRSKKGFHTMVEVSCQDGRGTGTEILQAY